MGCGCRWACGSLLVLGANAVLVLGAHALLVLDAVPLCEASQDAKPGRKKNKI